MFSWQNSKVVVCVEFAFEFKGPLILFIFGIGGAKLGN